MNTGVRCLFYILASFYLSIYLVGRLLDSELLSPPSVYMHSMLSTFPPSFATFGLLNNNKYEEMLNCHLNFHFPDDW